MAAQHLQLPGDDEVHGHRRAALGRRQQPDLHVPAPRPQAPDGVLAGDGRTQGVEGDVRAADGQLGDRGRFGQGVLGAEVGGQPQGRR